jgi:hypothetical protein
LYIKNMQFIRILKLLLIIFLFSTKVYAFCPTPNFDNRAYNVTSSETFSVTFANNCAIPVWFNPQNSTDTLTINSGVTLNSRDGYPFEVGNAGASGGNIVNNGTLVSGVGSVMIFSSSWSITNTGTIQKGNYYGAITAYGMLTTNIEITNTGTIATGTSTRTIDVDGVTYTIPGTGIYNTGIESNASRENSGTITTLNNLQGGNAPLTFLGRVPTNYNIIINSTSAFGKLELVGGILSFGTTTFGIYPGSTVAAGTYEDVLTGFSDANLSSLTGTYGAYNWTLASDGTNYDLVFTSSRSPYNSRVTSSNLTTFATHLETMRTNGRKVALTDILDDLTDDQFNKALKKMKGATIVKTATQSVQSQSSFKTALSTVTSPGSSSKITNLTKTNQGNLTFADLQTNNLYAKIQPANFSDDSAFFDHKNNQAPINALEFFKSNRNLNLVEKDDLKESGIFLRTFGSVTNYAAVNSDDNSYGSDSYGLLGGFQHKIDENLYQGYSLGFSKSKLTLDAGEGNTKTNTIHANVYRKMDEKEYGVTASLGGYVSFIDNVRNISETSEILKSSPTNGGLDFSLQYVKKMELLGLNFYPSASLTTTYGIVKNYTETGGSGSALEIKSHNVLAIKPEIGFTLENNFVQTDKITEGVNFSLFANRQQYLDGHTNTSSMIDENSWSASTLPKTKDDFLTAGIGYVAKNLDEKSDLNFNFFYTQSTNNSLNSSLFSISYNKTF